jgi:hypothetical protein
MIVEEGAPRLRGRFAVPDHVLGNGGLSDFYTQFEQLTLDVGSTPKRILLATRLCRNLIDPSKASLRSAPSGVRDLLITARNSWIIAADNLSEISQPASDALRRMATGGGYSTRRLLTDRSRSRRLPGQEKPRGTLTKAV